MRPEGQEVKLPYTRYDLNDQTHQALARVFPSSALRSKMKRYQGSTGNLKVLSHSFLQASGYGSITQDVGAFRLSFSGTDGQCLRQELYLLWMGLTTLPSPFNYLSGTKKLGDVEAGGS